MKNDKKILLFISAFILICSLVMVVFPKEERRNKNAAIRIGAGDDISGILMEETIKELEEKYEISKNLESSSFQDC